jgi:hypothetical protein
MPFWKNIQKAAAEIVGEVKDDLAGMTRGLISNVQHQRLINALSHPEGETLAAHKLFALTQCRNQIPQFTNGDAVAFFNQLNTLPALKYIRQENGFHKLFGEYGNTETYKKITELLKARVNENYKRHTQAENRGRIDDLAEEHKILELMTSRRGRLPNILASIGEAVGQTGEFNEEYKKRHTR